LLIVNQNAVKLMDECNASQGLHFMITGAISNDLELSHLWCDRVETKM